MVLLVSPVQEARRILQKVRDEAHAGYQLATLKGFAQQIRQYLLDAHKHYDALDPTGQKSNIEMIREVNAVFSTAHLATARCLFQEIEASASKAVSKLHLDQKVEHIEAHLAFVEINGQKPTDWACLDVTGKATGRQVEDRIKSSIGASQRTLSDALATRRKRPLPAFKLQ